MRRAFVLVSLFAVLGLPGSARADAPGLRFGLTDDPDTVFLGLFYDASLSRARRSRLVLEPGVDVGFGDNIDFFTIRGFLDAKYLVAIGRDAAIYPLVGISVYYINVDGGGDHTDVGLDLGGGLAFSRFHLQLALGIEDIPDFTFAFGFLF